MTKRKYKAALILTAATVLAAAAGLYFACDNPVTSEDLYKPPRNLRVTFNGTAVVLVWEGSEREVENGYEVWRSLSDNAHYEKIVTLRKGTLSYRDKEVIWKKNYFYKVRGLFNGEPGEFSNEVSVRTVFYIWCASEDDVIYKIDPNTCKVVSSIPTPGNVPIGLAWDGTYLWVDGYRNNAWRVFKVDPKTGSVAASFPAPGGSFPTGLAWDGAYLWLATQWDSPYFFGEVLKINPRNGREVSSFFPGVSVLTGLAWDGSYLWGVDAGEKEIFKMDPNSGSKVAYLKAPGPDPEGLAWDGSCLWHVDNGEDRIFRINPRTGSVVKSFNIPTYSATGLTVER